MTATAPKQRDPWEQLEGESTTSYIRFLTFRNMGPCRSVALAWKMSGAAVFAIARPKEKVKGKGKSKGKERKKPESVVGVKQWYNDSSDHRWRERAEAWDLDRLNDAPERVHSAIGELMIDLAHSASESLRTGIAPKTLSAALHVFKELCPHAPSLGSGESDTLPHGTDATAPEALAG